MDKPSTLAFSQDATFNFFRAEILIFLGIVASAFAAALATSGGPPAGLALPAAVMGAVCLGWIGIFYLIARGHRAREQYLIRRMFEGEIWECWQFSSPEWRALVEAECEFISPRDEGLEAYLGAVYSSIFGLVIALILVSVGIFAIDSPEVKNILWLTACLVFLVFLGAGLFQPLAARLNADRYRRAALQFAEPLVWFGPEGTYHEALGYTSLKDLVKVTDQTRSRQAIQFTLEYSTPTSTDLVAVPFPVPSGSEEKAGRLARRYREERSLA